MHIVMLEPLGVSEEQINQWQMTFEKNGHSFMPCLTTIESEEKKIELAKEADVLVIANAPLSERIIIGADKLKMISVAFTGVDHVPFQLCKDRNIMVCNAQGYCTDAVAELVIGLIINKLRNIIPCDTAVRDGKTKEGLVGHELQGKTIGIVGTGAIGRRVAEIAKVFRCNLLGYNPNESEEAKALGITFKSLEAVLAESDIVTLHTPLVPATKGLISKEQLEMMKPSALLINCARGPIVDSQSVAHALNTGTIAGACVDVFETEPPIAKDNPLLTAKNTIATPHIAFATRESITRRADITFSNISAFIEGKAQNVKL